MTPQQRRGRRLFLILATLIVAGKLGAAGHSLFNGPEISWAPLILTPSVENLSIAIAGVCRHWLFALALALSVPFLWWGYARLRWPVALACMLSGSVTVFTSGRDLVEFGLVDSSSVLDGSSVAFAALLGLVDVLGGLAFLFLPSVQAFFRHQREGPQGGIDRDRWRFTAAPEPRRFWPQLATAAGWGAALGGGVGIALSAHFLDTFFFGLQTLISVELAGLVAGSLVGAVAGLAAGLLPPKPQHPAWRVALTRGLLAAVVCAITLALVAGIWSGVSGERVAPIFGPPPAGWQTGLLVAFMTAVVGGPPVAAVAFVLGAAVALLIRDSE